LRGQGLDERLRLAGEAGDGSADEKRLWAFADVGFVDRNVYLFCASEGLATVFRASLDRTRLAQTLRLPDTKFITCAQTIGYPKA
jgi:nitroreductase